MLLSGCGSSGGSAPKPPEKKDEKPALEGGVETNAAEGVRYGPEPVRKPLWRLRWERSSLTYGEGGVFFGTAFGVRGVFFKGPKEASSFQAESVEIERGSNKLQIKGGVVVSAEKPLTQLKCEEATWDPDREVGEARGNVRVITEDYTLGPFPVIRFSPELKIGGTPKLFEERHGK